MANGKPKKIARKKKLNSGKKAGGSLLKKGSIKRLSRKAGVARITNKAIDISRNDMSRFVESTLKNALLYAENRRSARISEDDIKEAFRGFGLKVYATGVKYSSLPKCDTYRPKKKSAGAVSSMKKAAEKVPTAIREIAFAQGKNINCVYIQRAAFKQFVRDILNDLSYGKKISIQSEALSLLHQEMESFAVTLLGSAYDLTIKIGNRKNLMEKDLSSLKGAIGRTKSISGYL